MTETRYRIEGCPASIAFLADTHDIEPDSILASIRAHAPSLIVHTGDFLHGRYATPGASVKGSPNTVRLLQGCVGIAPTFVSIGNHEAYIRGDDVDRLHAIGVVLLDNTFVSLDEGKHKLVVGGLSSGYYTAYQRDPDIRPRNPDPKTDWLEGFSATDGFHILLMHHPEYFHLIPSSIELVLSGHAHGGQWRFYDLLRKQWRGVYAPNQGFFPELTGGIVDGRLIISRGLANTANLPRICNETEIIYIEAG